MTAVAMGLLWGSYTLMFWGYTLIKGYDISIEQIVIPGKYTGTWPPATTAVSAGTSNSQSGFSEQNSNPGGSVAQGQSGGALQPLNGTLGSSVTT
jgi:hypothetical protein